MWVAESGQRTIAQLDLDRRNVVRDVPRRHRVGGEAAYPGDLQLTKAASARTVVTISSPSCWRA